MNRLLIVFVLLAIFAEFSLAAEKVILVGSGAPADIDDPIVQRLKKMGFSVEAHAHDEKHPVNLTGASLVFISESTTSTNLAGAYKDCAVPVVNCETWIYDDMGFAPNDTGFNSDIGDTLKIVKRDHPITEGLAKEIKVYNEAIILMTANNLGGDLIVLATRADNENLVAISVYEKGAKTVTGQTKACNVNMFVHSTAWASLTTDSWKLVERSVLYAMGRLLAVEPSGKLATTWARMKD